MIEVSQVGFRYPGAARRAVEGLDFSVDRGEILGFLGPNGAGKSTTQKILIGLLRAYTGRVSVLGRPLAEWGPDYYEHVGVAFETPNHFQKLTGLENLTYFRALYSEATRDPAELLARVGLEGDGGMPVSHYSKGMQHRLSVARALLNDPELLFLDEPTAGLDPASARNIKGLIREQQEAGKTVFLTTHDMTVADALCDRVAFIVDGRIAVVEAPRELKLRHGEPRVRLELAGGGGDPARKGGAEAREFPLAGLGENAEFLALLREREVQTIHTLEATLEDVFIKVTGRRLE